MKYAIENTNIFDYKLCLDMRNLRALNTLVPQSLTTDKIGVGLGLYNLFSFLGLPFDSALSSRLLEATGSYSLVLILTAILIFCNFFLLFKISLTLGK